MLYKDITAHIALATISRDEAEFTRGEVEVARGGNVTYKLANNLNPFNLRLPEDLCLFTSVFIGAVKSCLV